MGLINSVRKKILRDPLKTNAAWACKIKYLGMVGYHTSPQNQASRAKYTAHIKIKKRSAIYQRQFHLTQLFAIIKWNTPNRVQKILAIMNCVNQIENT